MTRFLLMEVKIRKRINLDFIIKDDPYHFIFFKYFVALSMSFNKLILRGALVVLFCTIFSPGWSQSDFRNSIQTNIGFIPAVSASIERILLKPQSGIPHKTIRAGFTRAGFWGSLDVYYGMIGIVTNTSKHRLELGAGGGVQYAEGTSLKGTLVGNLGYRLNKRNSRWLFRTGIGFPEFLYVGFGFRF